MTHAISALQCTSCILEQTSSTGMNILSSNDSIDVQFILTMHATTSNFIQLIRYTSAVGSSGTVTALPCHPTPLGALNKAAVRRAPLTARLTTIRHRLTSTSCRAGLRQSSPPGTELASWKCPHDTTAGKVSPWRKVFRSRRVTTRGSWQTGDDCGGEARQPERCVPVRVSDQEMVIRLTETSGGEGAAMRNNRGHSRKILYLDLMECDRYGLRVGMTKFSGTYHHRSQDKLIIIVTRVTSIAFLQWRHSSVFPSYVKLRAVFARPSRHALLSFPCLCGEHWCGFVSEGRVVRWTSSRRTS